MPGNSPTSAADVPTKITHYSLCGLTSRNKMRCTTKIMPFTCFRCGRAGHGVPLCNAVTHADKRVLPPKAP